MAKVRAARPERKLKRAKHFVLLDKVRPCPVFRCRAPLYHVECDGTGGYHCPECGSEYSLTQFIQV